MLVNTESSRRLKQLGVIRVQRAGSESAIYAVMRSVARRLRCVAISYSPQGYNNTSAHYSISVGQKVRSGGYYETGTVFVVVPQ